MDPLEEALIARVKQGNLKLPPYPPVAAQLARVLSRSDFEVDQVVALLKGDAALAGAVLKVANSVAYSRGQQVATLPGAVMRIGARELSRHVLASGLSQAFGAPGPLATLRRRAWRESLASAFVCQVLAKAQDPRAGDRSERKFAQAETSNRGGGEAEFTAGLLHDVGKVVALGLLEELYAAQRAEPRDEAAWWALVERFHVELGMVLAAQWQLPSEIEAVMRDHHAEGASDSVMRGVHVADEVVRLLETKASVSAAQLRGLGLLSDAECVALAAALPQLPALLEAFAPAPSVDAHRAAVAVRLSAVARLLGPGRPVQVNGASSGPLTCELFEVGPLEFRLLADRSARANLLVQVRVDKDLCIAANVLASEPRGNKHEWSLRPYALSEQVARQWERFHLDVAKEAAAPLYTETKLYLRTVLV